MESLGIQLKPRIAIIGGGCAGLAAAAELAAAGMPSTIFEAGKQLGGRARGLNWKGRRLDNGQHILLGAYGETQRLLQLAGVDLSSAFMRLPLQLIQHQQFDLRASRHLPAPLHILAGVIRAKGLSRLERLAALHFMAKLKLSGFKLPSDEPLGTFLKRHHQPQKLVHWLWEPLCLAALNTPLDQASTQVFLNVLRDSFSRARSDSDLLLPRQDLSTLLTEPMAQYIQATGAEIRVGASIDAIELHDQDFALHHAERTECFSHVILAVSPFRAHELLSQIAELAGDAHQCRSFSYQPIYTVYLQYPDHVCLPFPMIGLSDGHAQWVLDRGVLDGQPGLLSVVISAEGRHQSLTQEALAVEVAAEMAHAFPHFPPVIWHKVIAEKRATFTCKPNLARPKQQTPVPNFYLAGDYTAGDYPATIEGAVRSGVKCAQLLLANL
jgi:squalene-associated FAD-dependent desaturase